MADNRFVAVVRACMSPVKCKLISSIGTTCAYPPPVAPPLRPRVGPREGSRSAMAVFFPIAVSASPSPTVTVDFPSPAGVGFIDVTKMSFAKFSGL